MLNNRKETNLSQNGFWCYGSEKGSRMSAFVGSDVATKAILSLFDESIQYAAPEKRGRRTYNDEKFINHLLF